MATVPKRQRCESRAALRWNRAPRETMMEEKPPDAEEPRPTLSVTLPAAPSIKKAGGAAALLHGLHLLLCVFSNAVYVSNEPGDDVLYPGQGYSFAITDKGKPNVMQREGSFVVTIQAALLFGFVVSLHALMLEYLGAAREAAEPSQATTLGLHAVMVSLYYFAQNDIWNAIDTSDIKFSMLGFTVFFNFLLALAITGALLQSLARGAQETAEGAQV